MKLFFYVLIFITLCSCQNDSQVKLDTCSSIYSTKEVNTASSPVVYSGSDKIAIRFRSYSDAKMTKLLLRASNIGNTAITVDLYRTDENADPDSGTLLGTSAALADTSPIVISDVWFKLQDPISFNMANQLSGSIVAVLSFGGGITLDYGASSGSSLRASFVTNSGFSWGYADTTHSISFGYEGEATCY